VTSTTDRDLTFAVQGFTAGPKERVLVLEWALARV